MKIVQRIIESSYCIASFPDLDFLEDRKIANCINIIKHFTKDSNYFFGLYREDGSFINHNDTIKYRSEIPEYFRRNGGFTDFTIDQFKEKKHFDSRISAVGNLFINEDTYRMIPNICKYYFETMFFEPLKSWGEFENAYHMNHMQGATYFIKNGYADLIFLYVDSGTFCIEFNTNVINLDIVIADIERFIY